MYRFISLIFISVFVLLNGFVTVLKRNKDLEVDEKTKERWKKKGLI